MADMKTIKFPGSDTIYSPVDQVARDEAASKQPKGNYALKSEIPNISGKLDADQLPTAIETALAQAKESGEFNGKDGTPGKTAYQYAQDGGYTGTEEEFAAKLAAEYQTKLTGSEGQVVGFDAEGNAVAQEAPSGGSADAVQYVEQTLDDTQKTQARTNIGAASSADVESMGEEVLAVASAAAMSMPGVLQWNGIIGDREYITFEADEELLMACVRISDEVPPVELLTGTATVSMGAYDGQLLQAAQTGEIAEFAEVLYIIDDFMFIITTSDGVTMEGITFPKKGVYAMAYSLLPSGIDASMQWGSALYIPGYEFASEGGGGASKYFETTTETTTESFGDTLTWDGDTSGRTTATIGEETLVHISDATVPYDELAAVNVTVTTIDHSTGEAESAVLNVQEIIAGEVVNLGGYGYVVYHDAYTVEGITFPEAGVYFVYYTDGYISSLSAPGCNFTAHETDTTAIIKTEHLPEALRFGQVTESSNTLIWDGNTDGLETVDGMYKIFDAVPSLSELQNGGAFTVAYLGSGGIETVSFTAENVVENEGVYFIYETVLIIPESTAEAIGASPGVYFVYIPEVYFISALTLNGYKFTTTTLTTIDPKYLPADIGGGLPEVTASDAGKFLRVSSGGEWAVEGIANAEEATF